MHEKKNTLLVVDKDLSTHKLLGIYLESSEFKIVESTSGKQGIRMCASIKPDLVLIELGLQDMQGTAVLSAIREWSRVPIIMLSDSPAEEKEVMVLNMGADDYVKKPFNGEVLQARINACLRKAAIRENGEPEICNGPLRMDLVRHQVFLHNELVSFTPKEYDLLRYFITNRGKTLTHKDILKEVWGMTHGEDKQYLRVFVAQIREKIENNPSNPSFIITEPGIGYRMEIIHTPVAAPQLAQVLHENPR